MGKRDRRRSDVHVFVGHPVGFVGPAGGDAPVAGVEMVFVDSGTVGYFVGSVRVRRR